MAREQIAADPPRRRLWRWVLLALFVGVGIEFGSLVYQQFANERLLHDAIADVEALDPDWRLEAIEARRAVVRDEENAADIIRSVRAMLPRRLSTGARRWTGLLESLSPVVRLTDEEYEDVTKALEESKAGIETALSVARCPNGRALITYSPDGFNTALSHVDDLNVVNWLVLQPVLFARIHTGDGTNALSACRAILNVGRSLGDEPFVTSQWIRKRQFSEAVRGLERLLGQAEVPEVELAAFQSQLAEEAEFDSWVIALRGERATDYQSMEALRSGQLKPSMLRSMTNRPPPAPASIDNVSEWINDRLAPDTRPAEAWALRYYIRLLESAKLPWPQRRVVVEAMAAELPAAPTFARDFLVRVPKFAGYLQSSQARGRCAVAALAIERYRLRHGDWPDSLAALVPELLPAVPTDPFDGQPLRYRRLPDGVVIYSISEDGRDDGGKLSDTNPLTPGTDLGVRLWDVPHRRKR